MVNRRTGCFPSAYLGAVHPMPSTGINGQLKAALAIAYFQNRGQKFGRKIQNMKSLCRGRFFIGVGLHNQSCDHEKSGLRNNYHCVLIVSLSVGRQIFRAISFVWSIIAKPLFSGSVCIVVCI